MLTSKVRCIRTDNDCKIVKVMHLSIFILTKDKETRVIVLKPETEAQS